MRLSVGMCFLIALTCDIALSKPQLQLEQPYGIQNRLNIRGHLSEERLKRALAGLIRVLLTKAKFIYRKKNFTLYHRFGGAKQAYTDFDELHPTDVKIYKDRRSGFVDKTFVKVTTNYTGKTEMTILKPAIEPNGEYGYFLSKVVYK